MSAGRNARQGRRTVGVLCVVVGLVYLALGIAQHDWVSGVVGLVIMLGYFVLLLLLSRRFEPAALLSGQTHDERQAQVMLKAAAVTGWTLTVGLVAGFIVAQALGASVVAGTLSAVAAVAGVVFAGATVWFSRRG